MTEVQEILDEQSEQVVSVAEGVSVAVELAVAAAMVRTVQWLGRLQLSESGAILSNAANLNVLNGVPKVFEESLAPKYRASLIELQAAFDAQVSFADRVAQVQRLPSAELNSQEQAYLLARRRQAADVLADTLSRPATLTRFRGLVLVGAPYRDFISQFSEAATKAVKEVVPLTELFLREQFRSVLQLLSERAQRIVPSIPLRFAYRGPGSQDPVIRPTCQDWMRQAEAGKLWSIKEIEALDNGQIPNVFVSCGGYGCRHSWIPTWASQLSSAKLDPTAVGRP